MASLLSTTTTTTTTTLQHTHKICFFPQNPSTPLKISFLTNRLNTNSIRCGAFFDNIPKELLDTNFYVDKFQSASEELPDIQKWGVLVFVGLAWIYLTARPGVLIGAIDAYLLAPIQLVLDSLSGRRNLKRSDFLIGNKIGEGSFGVVYSGVLVPIGKSGNGKVTKSKDKVILKKVFLTSLFIFPMPMDSSELN